MAERLVFKPSGLVSDVNDLEQIEFWGHDAGEFVLEEIADLVEGLEEVGNQNELSTRLDGVPE